MDTPVSIWENCCPHACQACACSLHNDSNADKHIIFCCCRQRWCNGRHGNPTTIISNVFPHSVATSSALVDYSLVGLARRANELYVCLVIGGQDNSSGYGIILNGVIGLPCELEACSGRLGSVLDTWSAIVRPLIDIWHVCSRSRRTKIEIFVYQKTSRDSVFP